MLRVTAVPIERPGTVPSAPGIIVHETGGSWRRSAVAGDRTFEWGGNRVRVSADPLRIVIADAAGRTCQDLRIAPHGRIDFSLGDGPLFGLGQGGRQFDRRGGLFERINGQGEGVRSIDMNAPGSRAPEYAFDLAGEGARITIPWLISADGWASYFHLPQGTFDLTDTRGQLIPEQADAFVDAFLVVSRDPAEIMRQYALLTGFSHLPPLWSLGYLQSHRTLASRNEVLAEVAEFRKRRLPCDGMIYLGTGFCPDGWNTGHDSFAFNPRIFPDPHAMLRNCTTRACGSWFVVDPPLHLHGIVGANGRLEHVAHYWARTARGGHRRLVAGPATGSTRRRSRASRICLRDRSRPTDRRPFALHAMLAGVQRYGGCGRAISTGMTNARHAGVGLSCGLTGIALWGNIGGFTTPELTGELYALVPVRQFCPLSSAAMAAPGSCAAVGMEHRVRAGTTPSCRAPDPNERHRRSICRKYLELRYRCCLTAIGGARAEPAVNATRGHYSSDAAASAATSTWGRASGCADREGRDATTPLPPGTVGFWSGEREGGQVTRAVDLATCRSTGKARSYLPAR
jgi:alpha-glucosidase/alpha-D-xyloside xylohydrolase